MTNAKGAGDGSPPEQFTGPITGADLLALIKQKRVLRGIGYDAPKADSLEELALAVSVLRGRMRLGNGLLGPVMFVENQALSQEERESDARKLRATAALQTLAEILPPLRAELAAAATHSLWPRLFQSDLKGMDDLLDAIAKCWDNPSLIPRQEHNIFNYKNAARAHSDAYLVPPISPVKEIDNWHHFASYLADKFRDVVQAANPNRARLGTSHSGPVTRFLAAVIPHITDQTQNPSTDAIYQHLSKGNRSP